MKGRNVARYGLLVALALILSYLESLAPAFIAVPGMKLGLTNLVVLVALFRMGDKAAVAVNLLRILLVAMLFGNAYALAYSLAGGLLSGAVMILLKRTGRFGMLGISVAGGLAHNLGQILAAMALMETWQLISWLPVLWISGMIAGLVVGLLGCEVARRLPPNLF